MQEFTIHLMVALNCFNVFSGLGKDSKGCEVGAWNQVKERFNNFILFSFRFINFSFHLFTFSFWFFVFYLLCLHIISCFFFIQYTWYSNYMAYNLQWGFVFFFSFFKVMYAFRIGYQLNRGFFSFVIAFMRNMVEFISRMFLLIQTRRRIYCIYITGHLHLHTYTYLVLPCREYMYYMRYREREKKYIKI